MEKIKYKRVIKVEEVGTTSEEIKIGSGRMGKVSVDECTIKIEGDTVNIDTRAGGDFGGEALYLSNHYDWVLCKDSSGSICLIPLKMETD